MRFNLKNSLKGQRYHCSIISESEWHASGDYKHFADAIRAGDIKTLCGLAVTGRSWDFPSDFARNENSYSGLPKCKKCLKHKNYPLLVLGEL
jgi:hypothetical protein